MGLGPRSELRGSNEERNKDEVNWKGGVPFACRAKWY